MLGFAALTANLRNSAPRVRKKGGFETRPYISTLPHGNFFAFFAFFAVNFSGLLRCARNDAAF
jgi:hypothetical protein